MFKTDLTYTKKNITKLLAILVFPFSFLFKQTIKTNKLRTASDKLYLFKHLNNCILFFKTFVYLREFKLNINLLQKQSYKDSFKTVFGLENYVRRFIVKLNNYNGLHLMLALQVESLLKLRLKTIPINKDLS